MSYELFNPKLSILWLLLSNVAKQSFHLQNTQEFNIDILKNLCTTNCHRNTAKYTVETIYCSQLNAFLKKYSKSLLFSISQNYS